jgi:hypothetical protein
MIKNIPNSEAYEAIALSLLNRAWETTLELLLSFDEAREYDDEDDPIDEPEYWKAAQVELSVAITLVQQAAEFLIKARIAVQSPYLLLSGEPKNWPRRCDQEDLQFADFRTLNAEDLIRVHDTFCEDRLSQAVKQRFDHLRVLRNRIMHTVDVELKIETKEIILAVLEYSHDFIGPKQWISARKKYLEQAPHSVAYPYYVYENQIATVVREYLKVIDILSPSEASKLLGFYKKRRIYNCHTCHVEMGDFGGDLLPKVALLLPNSSTSTNLRCFVCEKDYQVKREDCEHPGCKGNVIEIEDNVCLTCLKCNV